jgi:hypothetical protein
LQIITTLFVIYVWPYFIYLITRGTKKWE